MRRHKEEAVRRSALLVLCVVLGAISISTARAQFSSDYQTNIISGVTSNWTGDYLVGSNTTFDLLRVESGGVLSNAFSIVGRESSASNNSVVVSGTNAVWLNNGVVGVGMSGSGNSLLITNGGTVVSAYGISVGQNSGANNNSLVVTGTGSLCRIARYGLNVGQEGDGSSLIISDGGAVIAQGGSVGIGCCGTSTPNSNTVLITGAGSVWTNMSSDFTTSAEFNIGAGQLVISNGGALFDGEGAMGWYTNRFDNSVTVVGTGSVWRNRDLYFFYEGNQLHLRKGGCVAVSQSVYLSYFPNDTQNVIHVDEDGSLAVGGDAIIGVGGAGEMVISNGSVVASTVVVASNLTARGTLTLAGGTVSVLSGTAGALSIGYKNGATGTVWITGGELTVANGMMVVGDGGCGTMAVSNGTVTARSLTVGNGNRGTLTAVGGKILAGNLWLGVANCGATGIVSMTGGSLFVTNAAHSAIFEVRSGTLTQTGGEIRIDKLVVTNACGHFIHGGGTLSIGTLVLDPSMDADGDGIPNGWEQSHGLDPLSPADANADTDGDGQSNLAEFLAGTDPTNSDSAFRITSIAQEGSDVRVTWQTGIGKTNALQAATDLSDSFADIFTVTNTTGTTTNFLDAGAVTNTPARFYRVRLVP